MNKEQYSKLRKLGTLNLMGFGIILLCMAFNKNYYAGYGLLAFMTMIYIKMHERLK